MSKFAWIKATKSRGSEQVIRINLDRVLTVKPILGDDAYPPDAGPWWHVKLCGGEQFVFSGTYDDVERIFR